MSHPSHTVDPRQPAAGNQPDVNGEADSLQQAALQQLRNCRDQVDVAIRDRPVTAVMTLFGVGLGVGILASKLIAPAERRSTHQMITDHITKAVRDVLPNSIR